MKVVAGLDAEGIVPRRIGGDTLQRRPEAFLSATVRPWQNRQGGGDEQVAARAERQAPRTRTPTRGGNPRSIFYSLDPI